MDGIPAERTRDGCRSRQGAILAKRTQGNRRVGDGSFWQNEPEVGAATAARHASPPHGESGAHFWQNEPKEWAMPGHAGKSCKISYIQL
jgi:hypothetical protein